MAPPCNLNIVSAPEVLERSSAQLRVSGGVLDIGVAQPKLQPPSVVAGISQEVAGSVPQLVRMAVRESCPISRSLDHLGDIAPGHWSGTLAREHESRLRFL